MIVCVDSREMIKLEFNLPVCQQQLGKCGDIV